MTICGLLVFVLVAATSAPDVQFRTIPAAENARIGGELAGLGTGKV